MKGAFIFIMGAGYMSLYLAWIRPGIFAVLALIVYALYGFDKRRVLMAYQSNMAAAMCVAMYSIAFIGLAFLFGAGINADTPNMGMRLWRVRTLGSVVLMREMIRYKLIKLADKGEKPHVLALLTTVFAFVLVDDLRILYAGGAFGLQHIIFASVLPSFLLSILASLIALRGNFLSLITVSVVYSMGSLMMPFLPHVEPIPWALSVSILTFISIFIFRAALDSRSPAQKKRDNLRGKYFEKKPWIFNTITVGTIGAVIVFFLGVFPVYPVAVLTDSMSGTFEQGSMVFIRRVPEGAAYDMVGEGYIIHFRRNHMEYVHRAVEFAYGEDGRRVYITQGDSPEAIVDPWRTTQDDVLGIVVAFIPYIGWPYVIFRFATRRF